MNCLSNSEVNYLVELFPFEWNPTVFKIAIYVNMCPTQSLSNQLYHTQLN